MSGTRYKFIQNMSLFIPPDEANIMYENINVNYNEPFRAYHNLDHVNYCLDKLIEFRTNNPTGFDYCSLAIAIAFHDVVYKSKDKSYSNETESAVLGMEYCKSRSIGNYEVVGTIIISTEYFNEHLEEIEEDKNFLDCHAECDLMKEIDFAILGEDVDTYNNYAENIRKENENIPDDVFFQARLKSLETLKDMATFKYLDCQEQAKRNMEAEIDRIRNLLG